MRIISVSSGETRYLVGLAVALAIVLYGTLAAWSLLEDDDDGADQTVLDDLILPAK